MNSNYAENSKLLIIHADDAALCHSENLATISALEKGMVTSYSLMVPCPWFFEMAKFAKNNPQFDYGIHLTLTCEWENYKFGPILPIHEVPSLVEENGYFYPKRKSLSEHAIASEVRKELQAQIERALELGLSPSHLDSHMYSVGSRPDLLNIFRELAKEYHLPCLINRQLMEEVGLDFESNIRKDDLIFDHVYVGKYADFEKGKLAAYYEQVLRELSPGLNMILIHPAFDTQEMQGISVNHPNFGSEWRQIDFDFFTGETCKTLLMENNIQLITWKDLGRK